MFCYRIQSQNIALDEVFLIEFNHRTSESAGQDQPARMCRLILLYNFRKNKSMVTNERIRANTNESPIQTYTCLHSSRKHGNYEARRQVYLAWADRRSNLSIIMVLEHDQTC